MPTHTYDTIKIERLTDDDEHTYRIHGLPAGEDFRESSSYEELEASMLKVEGVAFATSGCEFGEYDVNIIVDQKTEGGAARIEFDQ